MIWWNIWKEFKINLIHTTIEMFYFFIPKLGFFLYLRWKSDFEDMKKNWNVYK